MNRNVTRMAAVTGLAALVGLSMVSTAGAFALRVPQIPVNGSSLQSYLNSVGESINVNTDQVNVQVLTRDASGNSLFTLMLELAGNANGNTIGIYNANEAVPTLFPVFPGSATPGYFAVVSFQSGGNLVVNLFNGSAGLVSSNSYSGVNATGFGVYLSGPGGLFYSEDGRNAGGAAQAIMFSGTGANYGTFWMAWEDLAPAGTDHDFDDAVLQLESVAPVPTVTASWGAVKAQYR
jgi:hypothetical protein